MDFRLSSSRQSSRTISVCPCMPASATESKASAASAFPGYQFAESPSADPNMTCFLTPEWIDSSGTEKKAWVCMSSFPVAADADAEDSF